MAKMSTDPKSMAAALGIAKESEKKAAEKTVRVNFNITESEHRKLKMMAAAQGRSIAEIMRECIKAL